MKEGNSGRRNFESQEITSRIEEWSKESEEELNDSFISTLFDPDKIDIETDHLHISELIDKMEHDELNLNQEFRREAEARVVECPLFRRLFQGDKRLK